MTDPVLTHMAAATLAIIFLVGAWQKLRDRMIFEISVDAYELVPLALVAPLALLLPIMEGAAGALLVTPSMRLPGAVLAACVLFVVTAAVVINLLRGHTDVGCGCGGVEDEQTLSWALVVRNAVLGAVLMLSLATPASRVLVWLDYVSTAAGAIALYGLYVLANQLIANQPRLLSLRNPA